MEGSSPTPFDSSTVVTSSTVRTVVVPYNHCSALVRVLSDVRSAVNALIPIWRNDSEFSRFRATKASYPLLRAQYPHLAAGWATTMANETSAVLNAWDRALRRVRRTDPVRFARMSAQNPHRFRLKASLHRSLFRFRGGLLEITLHSARHVTVDLNQVRNPLLQRYGEASNWDFGLTVREGALLFHFRLPFVGSKPANSTGIDLNFDSAVYASSDGRLGSMDLSPIVQIQRNMERKRKSIQRQILKDLRHQRAVLRRYRRREHRRVSARLHVATTQLLREVGEHQIILENLTDAAQTILRRRPRGRTMRRRLSSWTYDELTRMIGYKAHTPVLFVDPRGTSSECPRCGGHLAPPSGRVRTRETVCGQCGSHWHRDGAAAIAVLARGCDSLRGGTVPPSARNALLKAAAWRPGGILGPAAELMRGDDAKNDGSPTIGSVSG